ncbi:hypothetical protein N8787_05805, partial [Opitutaceae bacterium]|nr:hypothetical protein [Opitutaceae bacterium]
WNEYAKSGDKPDDVPTVPDGVYKGEGWNGWADWLGTPLKRNIDWRPFDEARAYVRKLGLKGQLEWQTYARSGNRPDDIPAAPQRTYKARGWNGTADWLGNNKKDCD